jgi:hypothetical protein
MKLICIFKSVDIWGSTDDLTIGKVYEVLENVNFRSYWIRNDSRILERFSENRFKTLREHNLDKLITY